MRRYIDANNLQRVYKEMHGGKRSLLIDTEPTVDVVEVVRCKDCKYRDTMPEYEYDDDHMHRMLMGTEFCRWWHDECPNDDDYCSYGERAEG